eukprot:TRINITY_DN92305_c0_g1_i1.p1 TRINITY_DN92305_c0_g1~~TRINITY_DN92305_c0_g1_i1.p1  ORF type:complete len:712 (+),score=160.83 TRINITY_DN92305_c0_g1_i1:42-2138(+)
MAMNALKPLSESDGIQTMTPPVSPQPWSHGSATSSLTPSPPKAANTNPRPNGKQFAKTGSGMDEDFHAHMQEELEAASARNGRIDEHKIEMLVRKCLNQDMGRPGTAFESNTRSARQQASRSLQGKAAWTSQEFWTVSAVEATAFDDLDADLRHEDVEEAVVSKVIAGRPGARAKGVDENLVRDVVSMTVKDIVGIFESLVDRLLIEKKGTTLKQMVTELMTDDIANTIALGQEHLKNREIGYIIDEIAEIRELIRENEAAWDRRFVVTDHLSQSIAGLRSDMEASLEDLVARTTHLEEYYLPRRELEEHLEDVMKEIRQGVIALEENTRKDEETGQLLDALTRMCHETLATREELRASEKEAQENLKATQEDLADRISTLDRQAARETRVLELQNAVEQRFELQRKDIWHCQQGLEENITRIRKLGEYVQEAYVTKGLLNERVRSLNDTIETNQAYVISAVEKLQASKAEKSDLQETNTNFGAMIQELDEATAELSDGLQKVTATATALVAESHKMASKPYCLEVARSCANEAVLKNAEKKEIEGLRNEVYEEQCRLREITTQIQQNTRGMNTCVDDINDLRVKVSRLEKHGDHVDTDLKSLWVTEGEHWSKSQNTFKDQGKKITEVNACFDALREEVTEHIDRQRLECERLREQSTRRYLEQMDRAMELHGGIEKLETNQKEMMTLHLPDVRKQPR